MVTPVTPTGSKPMEERKQFSEFVSADVFAVGGGLFDDLSYAAAVRREDQQSIIKDTNPKV